MGKAWKRFAHRRRTWGTASEAPPTKVEAAVVTPPAAVKEEVKAPTAATEPPAPQTTVKAASAPRTKRIKRKILSAKKK